MLKRLRTLPNGCKGSDELVNTPDPTIAETIIFLNAAADLNYTVDDLEAKYKQELGFLTAATDEQKNKIKRYLTAMLELLKAE